jgi:predicted  nucleic acid-binding Zn-ribbon protein
MMTSENDRLQLHQDLRQAVGDRSAATLMTEVFRMDPERVATKEDLAELRGEIAELRGEIADVRAELRGEIAEVRLDAARQTRQLTLTLLVAFLAHFAATAGLVLSLG